MISLPVVHGTSCGILSLNTYQTLFTSLSALNLEITVAPRGGQMTCNPKASKCLQLSKNEILVNQQWETAKEVINTGVGVSVCEV